MHPLLRNLFVIFLITCRCYGLYAQNTSPASGSDSLSISSRQALFNSDIPLEITLVSDFKRLVNEKKKEPAYLPATLILNSDSGTRHFDIKIKSRGLSRRTYDICSFPPLWLNFRKNTIQNSVFENQDKLKLVTYCRNTDLNEEYILEEYLIYKMFNLLTGSSYQIRLVQVTYRDESDKIKPITRFGFIIESDEKLAERNHAVITKTVLANQDRCDIHSIDLFTLFQYMIGNTDWWVLNFHNVTLIQPEGKAPVPVPFDFDYSGAINTPYAVVDPNLPVKTVRERYFRGYCRLPGTYEKTASIFNSNRDSIYSLYRGFTMADPKRIESTLKYYDNFYQIINDPKDIVRNIYDACELHHKHLHQQ